MARISVIARDPADRSGLVQAAGLILEAEDGAPAGMGAAEGNPGDAGPGPVRAG